MKKKCFRRTGKIHKLILAREPIYRHWHQKFIRLWVSLFTFDCILNDSSRIVMKRCRKSGGIDLERVIICVTLRAKTWKQSKSIKWFVFNLVSESIFVSCLSHDWIYCWLDSILSESSKKFSYKTEKQDKNFNFTQKLSQKLKFLNNLHPSPKKQLLSDIIDRWPSSRIPAVCFYFSKLSTRLTGSERFSLLTSRKMGKRIFWSLFCHFNS